MFSQSQGVRWTCYNPTEDPVLSYRYTWVFHSPEERSHHGRPAMCALGGREGASLQPSHGRNPCCKAVEASCHFGRMLLAGSVNSKHNISHEFAQFSLNNVTVITKSLSFSIGADEISEDFGGTNDIMFLWYFFFFLKLALQCYFGNHKLSFSWIII